MSSILLLLALCGDGGYKPTPVVLRFDRVIVQDVLDAEECFAQKRNVVCFRVIHLLNWYDDVGFVYEGWVLANRDRYFVDKRYSFFQKFIHKWWELRANTIDYEMSNRDIEDSYLRAPTRIQLKESG